VAELTPVGAGDHVLGAGTPGLTLIEYGDFGCPFCFAAKRPVSSLLERYKNAAIGVAPLSRSRASSGCRSRYGAIRAGSRGGKVLGCTRRPPRRPSPVLTGGSAVGGGGTALGRGRRRANPCPANVQGEGSQRCPRGQVSGCSRHPNVLPRRQTSRMSLGPTRPTGPGNARGVTEGPCERRPSHIVVFSHPRLLGAARRPERQEATREAGRTAPSRRGAAQIRS
jgi:hypothetical protein